jgi:hypothetical protein
MIEEHLRSIHCIHIGSGRNNQYQLDEFVHNNYHSVNIVFGHWQGGNKVHNHMLEYLGRIFVGFSRLICFYYKVLFI